MGKALKYQAFFNMKCIIFFLITIFVTFSIQAKSIQLREENETLERFLRRRPLDVIVRQWQKKTEETKLEFQDWIARAFTEMDNLTSYEEYVPMEQLNYLIYKTAKFLYDEIKFLKYITASRIGKCEQIAKHL